MVDLVALSDSAEELRAVTGARAGTPSLSWEESAKGVAGSLAASARGDAAPAFLADLLVFGRGVDSIGRALDWDGHALAGWHATTLGTGPPRTAASARRDTNRLDGADRVWCRFACHLLLRRRQPGARRPPSASGPQGSDRRPGAELVRLDVRSRSRPLRRRPPGRRPIARPGNARPLRRDRPGRPYPSSMDRTWVATAATTCRSWPP